MYVELRETHVSLFQSTTNIRCKQIIKTTPTLKLKLKSRIPFYVTYRKDIELYRYIVYLIYQFYNCVYSHATVLFSLTLKYLNFCYSIKNNYYMCTQTTTPSGIKKRKENDFFILTVYYDFFFDLI